MGFFSSIKNFFGSKKAGYAGASAKRSLRSWTPQTTSPNKEIEYDRNTLIARSRDLYKNNSIGRGAIQNLTQSSVGSGLRCQPRIDRKYLGLPDEIADEWEHNTEKEFNLWAEDDRCDIRKTCNFYELQKLAFQNYLTAGEVFVLLPTRNEINQPYDLRINLIEPDLIRNPNLLDINNVSIFDGIRFDKFGSPISYFILDKHPDDNLFTQDNFKEVYAYGKSGRRNVIHVYKPDRPGQLRGLPFLTPVIDIVKNITKYTDAYLQKQIVNSLYTVFIRSEQALLPDTVVPQSQQILTEQEKQYSYELGPGAIIGLAPGEEIQTATPGGSDPSYDAYVLAGLKQIAIGLNIPYEVFAKHFQASYSAARAAILDFTKLVKSERDWLSYKFNKPIYKEFLTEAILKGRITADGFFDDPAIAQAWLGTVWNGSTMGQIDPVKETKAYEMQVNNGFITRQDATSHLNGSNWESNMDQIAMENKILQEAGFPNDNEPAEKEEQEEEDSNENK
jgi:lambda family phage portal protein